jgi:hypothetical protein
MAALELAPSRACLVILDNYPVIDTAYFMVLFPNLVINTAYLVVQVVRKEPMNTEVVLVFNITNSSLQSQQGVNNLNQVEQC